jgi:hypothetical protein
MSQYLTANELDLYGCMPGEDREALEDQYPGITVAVIVGVSGVFDSMLSKRYGAPFETPYPDALKWNVAQVVAGRLMLKRGYNPESKQDSEIKEAHDLALQWLKDAADPEKGLVELPVKQINQPGNSAINSGAPLAYSEASPYTWTDRQREILGNGGA